MMSDNNIEGKEKHTKEDKLIKSTLIILKNNKNELNVLNKLKEIVHKIESLEIDNNIKFVIV